MLLAGANDNTGNIADGEIRYVTQIERILNLGLALSEYDTIVSSVADQKIQCPVRNILWQHAHCNSHIVSKGFTRT